jgi:hypothetical protein
MDQSDRTQKDDTGPKAAQLSWRGWTFLAVAFLAASLVVLLFETTNVGDPPHEPGSVLSESFQVDPVDAAPATMDMPVLIPPPPEIKISSIDSLLPRDAIQAIDEPQFVSASDGQRFMSPDEQVIGLAINGDVRAYPIPVLSVHEIVNDDVGGEPVAVTWCPLCYTALVFSRRSENPGEPLSFGVSGKLLHNTLIMYDRESDSLWSQLYGAAIDGPLAGTSLSFFPSVFTQWSAWVAQNPNTLVLDKEATCEVFSCGTYSSNPRGSYKVDPYESYYNQDDEGVVNRQIPRDSGHTIGAAKKRVLGVRIAGRARAYPFSRTGDAVIVNDNVNGVPVLVWLDPDTGTGLAYIRDVEGVVLTFTAHEESSEIVVDEETGSQWNVTRGSAITGPLRGRQLAPVFATSAFEFGWYDYFPDSETYSAN